MTKQQALSLKIGDNVYCTVIACRGWYRVIAIRPRDGYLKVSGVGAWCPPHNFSISERST